MLSWVEHENFYNRDGRLPKSGVLVGSVVGILTFTSRKRYEHFYNRDGRLPKSGVFISLEKRLWHTVSVLERERETDRQRWKTVILSNIYIKNIRAMMQCCAVVIDFLSHLVFGRIWKAHVSFTIIYLLSNVNDNYILLLCSLIINEMAWII